MRVFMIGSPGSVGGAFTERTHTMLLWRRMGLDVSCLCISPCKCKNPSLVPDEYSRATQKLSDAGVEFHVATSGHLNSIPGLRGSVAVSMCCGHTLHNYPELRAMGVKLIWSPTMNLVMPSEVSAFAKSPPHAIHYQSKFQAGVLSPTWSRYGVKNQVVIHGAWESGWMKFKPRKRGDEFVVGRLARPHRSKWSRHLWGITNDVVASGVNLKVVCMGWSRDLDICVGTPPGYATCLDEGSVGSEEFLNGCHAVICCNESVVENWPRVGLECMASGVPIVADNSAGWKEMLEPGKSGILCNKPGCFSAALRQLAADEPLRQQIIRGGRKRLLELADSNTIGSAWVDLFTRI
jgi:hypothetical protein